MSKLRLHPPSEGLNYISFHCPGCDKRHMIRHGGINSWSWNGSIEAPTFQPSVLVTGYEMSDEAYAMIERGERPAGGKYPGSNTCCHSFVTDGRIQFLSDCTHALAGQTVQLPDWPK